MLGLSKAVFLRLFHPWRPAVLVASMLALLVTLVACAPSATSGGEAGKLSNGPRLSFQELEHDFSKVSTSQPTEYRFALTNTGSQPLQIQEIRLEPGRLGA